MQEAGLIDLWYNWYQPNPDFCLNFNAKRQKAESVHPPRISVQHLVSPFLILVAGYVISTTAFMGEKLAAFIKTRQSSLITVQL